MVITTPTTSSYSGHINCKLKREQLILSLLPLARKYSYRYSGAAKDYIDDLYQEAVVAIIEVVDSDNLLEENITSYCAIAIKSKLSRFRFENGRSVIKRRNNKNQLKIHYNLHKLNLEERYSHRGCVHIANQLDVPLEEVMAYIHNITCVSIDVEENEAVHHIYTDNDVSKIVEKEELLLKALQYIETLNPYIQEAVAHKLADTKSYGKSVINTLALEMGVSSAWLKVVVNNVLYDLNADTAEEQSQMPTMQDIEAVCCDEYGVKHRDLMSDKRTNNVAFTRNLIMYLARQYTRLSFIEIANYFNRKEHTVAMYAVRKFDKMSLDENFKLELDKLKTKIDNQTVLRNRTI